ncbi:inositol monophosphatase family protein [Pseudactinotalea sp. Z1748]|uniref:inositol monophosphatase family protein n=1 Tax=Pseudactinotalea sp. Z1748 TaxID=3413027 RepID=UPI003C7C56E8
METEEILDLLRQAADEVIIPRFRALSDEQVQEKSPGDLVTVADREAEIFLTKKLQDAYPDAAVLGEEATSIDPRVLERASQAPHVFTIDPVDGTRNFVEGSPDYAVMVGEVRNGQTVRSWIYQPQHQRAYVAEAGAGAWCNGARLKPLDPPADPGKLVGATSNRELLKQPPQDLAPLEEAWWSCGIDYPRLASGEVDYLVYKNDWPWDHVPGALLVAEVGGTTARLDGSAYDLVTRRPWVLTTASRQVMGPVGAALAAVVG